jgi:hypothetical protein
MLAKSVPRIPDGAMFFEPKWDGFRSIIFRDGDEVEIGSRNEKPMIRYFPEIVEAVKASLPNAASSTAKSWLSSVTGSSSKCFSNESIPPPAG